MLKRYLFFFILTLSIITYSIPIHASTDSQLTINEVMPNPLGLDSDYEWVEIVNNSSDEIMLSDWTLNTNILPEYQIEPNEFIILANNKSKIIERYNITTTILETDLLLVNSGMTLTLKNTLDNVSSTFEYPTSTEGISFELLSGDCNQISSSGISHSIGEPNTPCIDPTPTINITPTSQGTSLAGQIIIMSVMPAPQSGESEWIELLNIYSKPIDINDWSLKDKSGGTQTIITESTLNELSSIKIYIDKFSLNNDGDTLYLYDNNDILSDTFHYTSSQKSMKITIGYFNTTSTDLCDSIDKDSDTETMQASGSINDIFKTYQAGDLTFNELKIYKIGEYPSMSY